MIVYLVTLPRLRALKIFLFIMILLAFIHIMQSRGKVYMSDKHFSLDKSVVDILTKNNCFVSVNLKKIDWHDYKFIKYELKRKGIGEQGRAAHLSIKEHIVQANMVHMYGLNGAVSDKISTNRSLPDTRHVKCKNKMYLESLPSVSIIVPFYNEHPKTLLRTIYSVINRSPEALIKEIILVDDASTIQELSIIIHNLTKYSSKIKLVHEKQHKGLITAKLIGATEASADVLVFLESYSEVNVNWLPPLLEPISMEYQTVVCPVIDLIDNDTFEYKSENECHRGGFDWDFNYIRLPIQPKDKENMPEPYENPVMMGGHFAISRIFFWELGGYDPGLYWGGEQYEISFKIWQCGGRMLTAPCSRIGHVTRFPIFLRYGDFMIRNYKRVAEVWMDKFAQYLYKRNATYPGTDVGDISKQKGLRIKLQCKSFKWFLCQVAPDILLRFPPIEPVPLAKGNIKTSEQISGQTYCVQADYYTKLLSLNYCYASKVNEQEFSLTWHKQIRTKDNNLCWELSDSRPMSQVVLKKCHNSEGNQKWQHDVKKKQIVHGDHFCLDWDFLTRAVYVKPCDDIIMTQQWYMNVEHASLLKKLRPNTNAIVDVRNISMYCV